MSKPQAKADIREKFRKQTDKIRKDSEKIAKAYQLQEQRVWMIPEKEGWDGNLFDLNGLKEPFKRDENHQDYLSSIQTGQSMGTNHDLMASQLQGDFLGMYERAFRERHKTSIRTRLHAAGRAYGTGHEEGTAKAGIQGYIKWLIQTGKS